MNEFDDHAQTLHFEVVKEEPKVEKTPVPRSEDDEFTEARRGKDYEIREEKESGNGGLIAAICVLSVLLICAIVVTVIVLTGDKKETEEPQPDEEIAEDYEEEEIPEEEEKIPEEDEEISVPQKVVYVCDLVLSPKSISKTSDGGYRIKADFLDSRGNVKETKRIVVNEDTDIRLDGKRLTLQAFIYYVEETDWTEIVVFKSEMYKDENIVTAISFETPPEAEEVEIPEEIEIETEVEIEEETEEENPPEEDADIIIEGI